MHSFRLPPRFAIAAAGVLGLMARLVTASSSAEVDPDEMELVREIHAAILAQEEELADEVKKEPYSVSIPGSRVSYEMIFIPAGDFVMGSPESEVGRAPDEGPRHRVEVAAFWMGEVPVTWNEFNLFMHGIEGYESEETVDAVSRPSPPYLDMTFGMGTDGFPAVSMTHHAANKYCQWLSAKTGHFYRLPTEAEWEYAARAGTETLWSFGDDPEDLDDFAWYRGNSGSQSRPVGQKRPNPWGFYDMHGNVWEWTLDQYRADRYEKFEDQVAVNPWEKAATEYPRVVRGGSWNDGPLDLRSAARRASHPDWKMMDPQLPQSRWYHTNAPWLGFRIVRPLEIPSPEEMYEYWNR